MLKRRKILYSSSCEWNTFLIKGRFNIIFHILEKSSFFCPFFDATYTHWHVSRVVYKWWHLADCNLSQFIKQKKIHFVNKRACVTNFLAEKQQMALVVCHSVYGQDELNFFLCVIWLNGIFIRETFFHQKLLHSGDPPILTIILKYDN